MVPTCFRRALCLLLVTPAHAFTGPLPSSSSLMHQGAWSPTRRCDHGHVRQREGVLYAGTVTGSGLNSDEPATVLRTAVDTRKVPAEEVSEALRVLAEDSGPPAAVAAEDVEGSWQLVFSTQLKKGYMPIRELVGFYPSREEATIDATAGPLPIGGMRGQCWWKGGPENELAFSMGAVKLGPFKLGKDKNEVKSYKFFVNDGKILAAKSSSGGFALLSRVMPEE